MTDSSKVRTLCLIRGVMQEKVQRVKWDVARNEEENRRLLAEPYAVFVDLLFFCAKNDWVGMVGNISALIMQIGKRVIAIIEYQLFQNKNSVNELKC